MGISYFVIFNIIMLQASNYVGIIGFCAFNGGALLAMWCGARCMTTKLKI